jgi:hypothetical protein
MEEEKQVSPSLMRQMLLECGLGARIRPKKWEISPINRKKRLEWAKCMLNLSLDDWKRIVFTDESKFEHRVGAQYIRGSTHQSTFDNYAVCSNRWGPSVMVWGAISAEGIFHIEFLNGKVDGAAYKIVLEKAIGHRVAIFQRGELYFQQDNATVHTCNTLAEYFTKQGFKPIPWPPKPRPQHYRKCVGENQVWAAIVVL